MNCSESRCTGHRQAIHLFEITYELKPASWALLEPRTRRYHIIEKEPCCASQQDWPADDPVSRAARPNAHRSSTRDVLFLPLLGAHGLVRDGINDVTLLRALVEHSEVLTQDHKGRQLVVHLDAKRARGALRHRRDRGGRVLVELFARDQQNLDALGVLSLLATPRHRLGDVSTLLSGLIGPGDRKSIQPMAKRLGVWDAAPVETELLDERRLTADIIELARQYEAVDLTRSVCDLSRLCASERFDRHEQHS